jgi:F-type H+-transporting ATPase subunit a
MGELLSASTVLVASASESGHEPGISLIGRLIYIALVLTIIFACLTIAKGGIKERIFKNPFTQAFEQLYMFIENMCISVIGAHGRKYIPIITTFWLVIFFGNVVALLFPYSPTADLGFNLGMAITSIFYVQYEGIKANGLLGHFGHFAGPKLGGIMALLISPVIFCIEIISELMKNASLSLRIYGNIHGGHEAVHAMNHLGESVYVPFGEFLLPIKLLTVVVQAMIFSLLTCVYLSLVTHHEDEHHEAHGTDHASTHA